MSEIQNIASLGRRMHLTSFRISLADVLSSFTFIELKVGMEELNISTKGNKQDLIDRLLGIF